MTSGPSRVVVGEKPRSAGLGLRYVWTLYARWSGPLISNVSKRRFTGIFAKMLGADASYTEPVLHPQQRSSSGLGRRSHGQPAYYRRSTHIRTA